MTDNNKIIKLLEAMSEDVVCSVTDKDGKTLFVYFKDILAIINRQKAEIERLTKELKETTEKFNCQQYVYVDLSNIIKEKIAEIERLNKEVDRLSQIVLYHDGHIADAKAEAIKEFAERLKEKAFEIVVCGGVVRITQIDNLVKEMVGENNV